MLTFFKEVSMTRVLIRMVVSLALIPALVFSAQLQKTYTFGVPTVDQNGEVSLEGCEMSFNSGTPAIPTKSVKLLLPAGEKAISFEISYTAAAPMRGTYDIKPVPLQLPLSQQPTTAQLNYRSPGYANDAFYPTDVKSPSFSMTTVHGYNIFLAALNPVQYNPVTGELRSYSSITVTVNTETDHSVSPRQLDAAQRYYISTLIDNPEAANDLPLIGLRGSSNYDYLIITTDALSKGFTDFVEFNKRRALKTKIETIENVSSKTTGENTQDKIRNYIKSQYDSCRISFVLLAADDDKIPARGMRATPHDYDSLTTPGTDDYDFKQIADDDMYYGCLDGTWKLPNGQYYGEYGSEDGTHEVYIGRICMDNATDQKSALNKIMLYSERPVADGVTKSLLLGEALWGKGTGNNNNWPIGIYGDDCMEEFKSTCTHHYSTTGFNSNYSYDHIYGKESSGWQNNSSTFISKVKSFKPAWIDHLGHANNSYVMSIRNSDLTTSNFTNDGTNANFFIVFSQGCYPGSYDNVGMGSPMNVESTSKTAGECLAEKWLNLATGPCAVLMNSRFGFGASQSTNGSAQRLHRFFHDALFNKNLHHIGAMLGYCKDINADGIKDAIIKFNPSDKKQGWNSYFGQLKWQAWEVNLLGDPAMNVWSAKPDSLKPTLPDAVKNGKLEFQTQPLARVAVLNAAGDIEYSSVADDKGNVKMTLTSSYSVEKKINICAANYYPCQRTIKVDPTNINTTMNNNKISNFSSRLHRAQNAIIFSYSAASAQKVTLSLYAFNGKCILQQVQHIPHAGDFTLPISNRALSSGCYYAELTTTNARIGLRLSTVK